VEDELRASLLDHETVRGSEGLAAAFASAHVEIAGPIIERSGAAADQGMVGTLIRRTEEHLRFHARGLADMPLLIELIRDADAAVADHAMAILIAHTRRLDSFSEPAAARTDLPAELIHRLVWRVTAALRHYMVAVQGADPRGADDALVDAAERLIARHDEGDSLDSRAMRLARRLEETGRLDDSLIERALSEGSFALFIGALALRAGLGHASAWEIISDPNGRGPAFILKAAGVERPYAISILLVLAGAEHGVPAQVDVFDVTDLSSARQALRFWQANPGYREAVAELSQ
jgi:uncharacterized protein (DUF2336 family)